jgi:hypothetical protein
MNQNGFNSYNQFEGPVFIDGDTEIDGNLDVSGTINGGGGGGFVTNPLTADIDGNNKNILFLNDIHIRRLYNNTYPPANYIDVYGILRFFSSWIDMQSAPIYNVNSLTCSLNNIPINLDLVPLTSGAPNQVLARDPNYDPNQPLTHRLVWQTPSTGGGVQNPMTSNLNCNNFFVTHCAGLVAPLNANMFIAAANIDFERSNLTDINQIEGITVNNRTQLRVMGDLLINDNIDMLGHPMFNILDLRSVDFLKLDLMPSTQGLPNQVLSRSPTFDPNNPNTHKLTWQTISAGGVQNPMTTNLDCNNKNLTNVNTISGLAGNSQLTIIDETITVRGTTATRLGHPLGTVYLEAFDTVLTTATTNAVQCLRDLDMYSNTISNVASIEMPLTGTISSSFGTLQTSIFWAQALKKSTEPFYHQFNTTYITPIDSQGIIIDSKLPSGASDSSITLSAPTININNSTNLAPSVLNTQIIHIQGAFQGDNMQIRSDLITSGVFTPITIQGSPVTISGITEHFNDVKMINNDILDIKDLKFNTGFIIPSSIGSGIKDQVLTTDGKNAKWEYGIKIPYKIWDGANILPITTTPQDLSVALPNKFRGSNIFPAGYFEMGDTLKIKFNGYVDFGGTGNNIISIFLNGVQHVTFTFPSASSGGSGISAYSADITLVAQIASNLTFSWSTCVYNQNKTGQNAVPPQCVVGSQVSSGSPLNVANTITVRFSQSVSGSNLIKVLSMVYEIC